MRKKIFQMEKTTDITRLFRYVFVGTLIIMLMCSAWPQKVGAAAGDLDPSFGHGGTLIRDFFGYEDRANDVAVQADGKIVAVGFAALTRSLFDVTNADFAVERYRMDGSLDTSFGTGGRVTTDFSGFLDIAEGVAIQADGKIVVAGYSLNFSGTGYDFALARYNSDGSLDTSFGNEGKVTTDFSNTPISNKNDFAFDIAIQPDGKIVAAGHSHLNQGSGDITVFACARYKSDGSPDTDFDGDGRAITKISRFENLGLAVAIQPDGKIVIAGYMYSEPGYNFAVARYNPDGSPDNGFGSNGVVTTDFAFLVSYDFASDVAIQTDGKIVVAGRTDLASSHAQYFALTRYNTDGSLDTGFGTGGKLTTSFNFNSRAQSVAIQKDGKIVAGGDVGGTTPFVDFAVVRYNGDGSLDASFGSGGKVTTNFLSHVESINAIALQGNGDIIAAGYVSTDDSEISFDPSTLNFGCCPFKPGTIDLAC